MGNAALLRLRDAAAYYNVGEVVAEKDLCQSLLWYSCFFCVSFALADSAVLFKDLMEGGVESKQLSHACFCTLLF
jgi:hypothetical protein